MEKKKAYLLLLILLFFSGNPLINILFGKFTMVVAFIPTYLLIHKNIQLDKQFFSLFKFIFLGVLTIGILQYMEFYTVSWLGMLNLLAKFLLGGIIFYYLKDRFSWVFFKVLSDLSVLSLVFFLLINLLKIPLPSINLGNEFKSYIIYSITSEEHILQNGGMFWEPGAHAGILTLCLALNFNKLRYYWVNYRYRLIAILLALLSAQSTTGYLVGFVILLFFFVNKKNIILLPIFLFISFTAYESSPFLRKKIESQFDESKNQKVGELSNTRFGSVLFDWHYIQKHPLIGNGLDETTRYADHKYLFVGEKGDVIGSGNGFTGTLASLGVLFIFTYFYFLWKATVVQNKIFAILVLISVFLNLQGEQWLNFPIYLGLPFLLLKPVINKKNKTYKKLALR